MLEERIHTLQRKKDFENASAEAEKALVRYPNDFIIVFRCGEMYQMMGIEMGDRRALEKAVELYEHAVALLSQNTDPVIGEATICKEIAQCLIELGREADGIEIMKKYNICGINDAAIGYSYATSKCFENEDPIPYLVRAYADCMQTLVRTMCGFANMFERKKDYASALDAMQWLIRYMESLKASRDEVAYADKLMALFYEACCDLSEKLGRIDEARAYLKKAYEMAVRFDANPSYGVKNLKFCIGDTSNATAFDSTGNTAIEAVENGLKDSGHCSEIRAYWEELKDEGI